MGNLHTLPFPAAAPIPVGAVPEGKIVDFLTGRAVNDTPEEYVRQNLEKALVRQYRYSPTDCSPEFAIKVGSARKRVDIAVFKPVNQHEQSSIFLILETKKAGTSSRDRNEGIGQLQSYMAACPNAEYGLWTNGDERHCYAKRVLKGTVTFEEIVDIPGAGQQEAEAQRPKRKDLMPAAADNLLFAFRRCHNYIAGSEGMQKPEAFWELLKLIFCKIEDERSGVLHFYSTSAELSSGTAASPAKNPGQRIVAYKSVRKYSGHFTPFHTHLNLQTQVVAEIVNQL